MNKPHTSLQFSSRASRGLTLVEVMISMLILTLAGLGLIKVTYQLRVTAEDNIHQSTATVLAQGYLEQLCRLPYNSSLAASTYTMYSPPGLVQIANGAAVQLTDNNGNAITTLTNGGAAYSAIVYLDQDVHGNPTYPMNFSITNFVVTDLSKATGGNASHSTVGSADGMSIEIDFSENYVLGGVTRSFSSSVRTVVANVDSE